MQLARIGAELPGELSRSVGGLEAEHQLLRVMATWKARARELGGSCHRPSKRHLVVTLPEEVPVIGREAFTPWFPTDEAERTLPG